MKMPPLCVPPLRNGPNYCYVNSATGVGLLTRECLNSLVRDGYERAQAHCFPDNRSANHDCCKLALSPALLGPSMCPLHQGLGRTQKYRVLYFVPIQLWLACCHVWYNDGSRQRWRQSGKCKFDQQLDSCQSHQRKGPCMGIHIVL